MMAGLILPQTLLWRKQNRTAGKCGSYENYIQLCGNFKVLEIYISKSYKYKPLIYTIIN